MEAVATEIAESFEPAMTEGKAAAATAAVTAAAGGHKCESIVGDLCVHGPFRENLCIPTSLQSQDYEVRRIVIGHRRCAAPHEMRYTTRAVDRSRLEASGDAIRMAGWSTQTTGKSPSQNPQTPTSNWGGLSPCCMSAGLSRSLAAVDHSNTEAFRRRWGSRNGRRARGAAKQVGERADALSARFPLDRCQMPTR